VPGPRRAAIIACLLAPVAVSCRAAEGPPTAAGPFTIEARSRRISSGAFPNTSGNPFSRVTVSEYRLRLAGRTVAVGEGEARTDRFWEARVLSGAPRPAVLVATTGAWLVTESGGKAEVTTLTPPSTDSVRWQWLDADGGQPGEEQAVGLRDSAAEPRTLAGGNLLLVSRRGVLEVDTLRFWPLAVVATETLGQLEGFHAGNARVEALSPGRTQVVLIGDRRVDDLFEHALVVLGFASGEAYAVPFDSQALRFASREDATREWLAHYFTWTREPDGRERLRLREPVRSLPWRGRLVRFGDDVEYRLSPVRAALAAPLGELIERGLGGRRLAPEPGAPASSGAARFEVEGRRLALWFDAERRTLALSAEPSAGASGGSAAGLVERIAARFDALLATGAHQDEFTTFPDHR